MNLNRHVLIHVNTMNLNRHVLIHVNTMNLNRHVHHTCKYNEP